MKRIITLGISLLMISSLAWVEKNAPVDLAAKAYRLDIGTYKVLVVSPVDSRRSVLIGLKKPLQKNTESYLAEGVIALAISRVAKLTGRVEHSKPVDKYVKEMVQARSLALKDQASENW